MKKDIFFGPFSVFTAMAIYFIVAITHVFFLSPVGQSTFHRAPGHSIFKRKTENLSVNGQLHLLQRPDKSTLDEKKSVIDVLRAVVTSFILLFFTIQLWKLNVQPKQDTGQSVVNYQYSYLSFCTFRI